MTQEVAEVTGYSLKRIHIRGVLYNRQEWQELGTNDGTETCLSDVQQLNFVSAYKVTRRWWVVEWAQVASVDK